MNEDVEAAVGCSGMVLIFGGMMTQREAILDMLRAAGSDGLCSLSAYRRGPAFYNSRNRVSELGHDGYVIRSDRCVHDEQTPSHVRWTLTREPTTRAAQSKATQLSLLAVRKYV